MARVMISTAVLLALMHSQAFAQGRLTGTGGVSSISGASGGGLIPWATMSSLATREQMGGSVFATRADVDDFELDVAGFALNLRDRLELSFATREFTIKAADATIEQQVTGLKLRVAGDLVYGPLPQITVAAEHQTLKDPATARAVGARKQDGTDYYVSAAKVWIDGIFHRTTLLNLNLRRSSANQYGILGHGGDDMDSRYQLEAAVATFINREVAIGFELRQKPDNLSALKEHHASDVFVAWFPSKHLALTVAWVRLGEIAGAPDQNGYYLSLQGGF